MRARSSAAGVTAVTGTATAGAVRVALVAVLVALMVVVAAPVHADTFTTHDRIVSDDPVNWTPHVLDGRVLAIAEVGEAVVVGGSFTRVREPGGTETTRNYLFAFDADTGAILPGFTPSLDNQVETLAAAPDGESVLVGGRFNTVNGTTRKGLARIDLSDGALTEGFDGRTNRAVFDLVVHGDRMYIGGNFTRIRGTDRTVLAALDVDTGALLDDVDLTYAGARSTSRTVGTLSVDKLDVTPDGSRLVTIGNFGSVDGQPRHQVAVIDLTTSPASLADWATDAYQPACRATKWPAYLRDMDVSPDGEYFVIVTTGAYSGGPPSLCDTAARWDLDRTGTAVEPTWVDYAGGDTLYGVGISGEVVYIGGHQRWLNSPYKGDRAGPGAVVREGIAALDPLNGLPLSWDPGRDPRGLGTFELLPGTDGLWVGSDTGGIGGEYHDRIALMPLAGGAPLARPEPPELPTTLYLAGDGQLSGQDFDGSDVGSSGVVDTDAAWSDVRGAVMLSGALYYGRADGTFPVRGFDGTDLDAGSAQVDLRGLTDDHFPVDRITGMYFDEAQGRLYYTVEGTDRLYYRYFTPESNVVGAQQFTATASSVVDWSEVRGMAAVEGVLYHGTTGGDLRAVDLTGHEPVPGTGRVLSGPGVDGRRWDRRGLFLRSGGSAFTPPDPPPDAAAVFEGAGSANANSWQVFAFDVDQTGPLLVHLDWDDPAADLNVFLRGPDGVAVATSTGGDKPKVIEHEAQVTGRWSVAVKIKAGTTAFQILVNPTGDEYQPPAPRADYEFAHSGSATGDSWETFAFDVAETGTVSVELDWDDPAADLNVFLRGPDGVAVATSTGGDKPKVIEHEAQVTGRWSVAVKIKAGAAAYEVLVDVP